MEIKAQLNKPYTSEQRELFIVNNNHKLGYEIKETELALEAWGYTDEELLLNAKANKQEENTTKAQQAIQDGYVVFKEAQFETNTQTANDLGNKRDLCILRGDTSALWLSKDDKVVELVIDTINPAENDDFVKIGFLVEDYKEVVWNVKYMSYKQQIEEATKVEEVEAIVIEYDIPDRI